MADCAGVLLTGGASRRLGVDKATLRLDGDTLAERAARVLGEVCAPVVEVGPGRSGLPHVVEDPPGRGPLAALAAGFAWLGAAGYQGPVIVLGVDLPRAGTRVLRLLADHPGDGTVVPRVGGRFQLVCARYGARAAREADALLADGHDALRDLLDRLPYDVLDDDALAVAGGADALADVDTADDARRLGLVLPDDA